MRNRVFALAAEREAGNAAPAEVNVASEKYPRVTVRLTGELGEEFRKLQEITRISSPSELVRRSIVIYHTLVMQKMQGNDAIIEVKKGDEIVRIPVFL